MLHYMTCKNRDFFQKQKWPNCTRCQVISDWLVSSISMSLTLPYQSADFDFVTLNAWKTTWSEISWPFDCASLSQRAVWPGSVEPTERSTGKFGFWIRLEFEIKAVIVLRASPGTKISPIDSHNFTVRTPLGRQLNSSLLYTGCKRKRRS